MIRKAVGAVIQRDGEVLLVHKVKGAQGKIKGMWDFPKGGMEPQDQSVKEALLRELEEETGSTNYTILKQYPEKIVFEFDPATRAAIGYEGQETTMFSVRYDGDGTELAPQDDEIEEIRWFTLGSAMPLLFPEAKQFVENHILERDATQKGE